MSLLIVTGILAAGAVSIGLGVHIANQQWRKREERRKPKAPEPSETSEPDHIDTFTNIRLPVNLVVQRCDVVRAAKVLREHTSPTPLSDAAE